MLIAKLKLRFEMKTQQQKFKSLCPHIQTGPSFDHVCLFNRFIVRQKLHSNSLSITHQCVDKQNKLRSLVVKFQKLTDKHTEEMQALYDIINYKRIYKNSDEFPVGKATPNILTLGII